MKEYIPNPMDTQDVQLPEELSALAEEMSKNVHEVWAQTRMEQGWTYGEQRDDDAQYARLHLAAILHEAYYGIQQVGYEPGYKKGNEHIAQSPDQDVGEGSEYDACESTYETVESDGLFVHVYVCLNVLWGTKIRKKWGIGRLFL